MTEFEFGLIEPVPTGSYLTEPVLTGFEWPGPELWWAAKCVSARRWALPQAGRGLYREDG